MHHANWHIHVAGFFWVSCCLDFSALVHSYRLCYCCPCCTQSVTYIWWQQIVGRRYWQVYRRAEVTCYSETRDHRWDLLIGGCHGDSRSARRCQVPSGQHQRDSGGICCNLFCHYYLLSCLFGRYFVMYLDSSSIVIDSASFLVGLKPGYRAYTETAETDNYVLLSVCCMCQNVKNSLKIVCHLLYSRHRSSLLETKHQYEIQMRSSITYGGIALIKPSRGTLDIVRPKVAVFMKKNWNVVPHSLNLYLLST